MNQKWYKERSNTSYWFWIAIGGFIGYYIVMWYLNK